MKMKKITVALDMRGCPNRCRHCWIGHSPNGNLTAEDLKYTAAQFRPYTDCLEVYDWYREPDFHDDYRQLWDLCEKLSDVRREHYELISVWRLVRDREYGRWLSSLGLKAAQLTLFGGPEKTDYYTGRKGAYNEILEAADILLKNGISPRFQIFVNKDNLEELPDIEKLIEDMELEKRCRDIGGVFHVFLHQGSCDGENEKLYDIRVTAEDLRKIPEKLAGCTLQHLEKRSLEQVFGRTEQSLFDEFLHDSSVQNLVSETPVFFVDRNFDVYPNVAPTEAFWRLGNLKEDGAEAILKRYGGNESPAQHVAVTVPLSKIAAAVGDPDSRRLFTRGDYAEYLTNKYCRERET